MKQKAEQMTHFPGIVEKMREAVQKEWGRLVRTPFNSYLVHRLHEGRPSGTGRGGNARTAADSSPASPTVRVALQLLCCEGSVAGWFDRGWQVFHLG